MDVGNPELLQMSGRGLILNTRTCMHGAGVNMLAYTKSMLMNSIYDEHYSRDRFRCGEDQQASIGLVAIVVSKFGLGRC